MIYLKKQVTKYPSSTFPEYCQKYVQYYDGVDWVNKLVIVPDNQSVRQGDCVIFEAKELGLKQNEEGIYSLLKNYISLNGVTQKEEREEVYYELIATSNVEKVRICKGMNKPDTILDVILRWFYILP